MDEAVALAPKPRGVSALRKFFEKDAKPVPMSEMKSFWESLTVAEKTEFAAAAEAQI